MALSTELISQFAKVVVKKEPRPESVTVTGTAKLYDGKIYVQIDGSNGQLTPIASSTVGMADGDRVTVQIKNHSATVTGNATDPSAGKSYADDIKNQVDDVSDQISEFEIVIADKVDTDQLNAVNGRIDNLVSENVTITGKLDAVEADIGELTADNVTINEKLTAAEADIENLTTTKLDASIADIKYATIENLEATNADIHNLEADYGSFKQLTTDNFSAVNGSIANLDAEKLDVTEANIKYAQIDFANIGEAAIENLFSKSGIIGDLVMDDGHVTGTLVGVTIIGDLIEGGTVKADKLVVQGEDGLYYKLNVSGESVAAEQTEYNSLNGSVITAKSITAEKVNVSDLVAFNATIGGYHITEDSLYSGVKSSATNTTRGVFMNDDGEFAIGDASNFVKFFKDIDGQYKLAISASQISMGGSTNLGDAVKSQTDEFYQSTSPTELIGGSWSTEAPVWEQGKFVWRRTLVTYLSGETDYIPSQNGVCYSGNTGEKGDPGEDGKGIKSTAVTYQAHTSQTSAPTGTWSSSVPALSTNKPYLWTRTVITYDDNTTTSTSYSVSSTLESFEVGGRNLVTTYKDKTPGSANGMTVEFIEYDFRIYGTNTKHDANYAISNWITTSTPYLEPGQTYTLSTTEPLPEGVYLGLNTTNSSGADISTGGYLYGDGSKKYITFTVPSNATGIIYGFFGFMATLTDPVDITFRIKLELGNKATDWTPAPEDVQNGIDNAQTVADDALNSATGAIERVNSAELEIDSINATIQNLVIGQDGETLMTIDENGVHFDFTTFQEQITEALTNAEVVENGLNETNSVVDDINHQVGELNELKSYITMGDDTGTPFIELGSKQGDFKVRITNTEMAFMQGTQKIAYITNKQLYIQSSVVTDELKIGDQQGYIWKRRSNGHMGLRYVTTN